MSAAISWIPEAVRFGVDSVSGAEIEQLTSEPVTSHNIYCEQRYASADGSRIALLRAPFGRPSELWVCDLRSLRLCRMAEGFPVAANARRDAVYYIASGDGPARLMRLDLAELSIRALHRFEGEAPATGAVSPDERWFLGGPFPVRENRYRLVRIDLRSGAAQPFCELEDMMNPHLQFEPSAGRYCMVQINRGAMRNPVTGGQRLAGRLGATLALIEMETGAVLSLPVGRPHTYGITGHECWAGDTGRLLFTAGRFGVSASAHVTPRPPREGEPDLPPAILHAVAPGDAQASVVASDRMFNHLAASDDGRFFIADDHATGRVYIGSIATGRSLGLCDSGTRQGACQYSHVHAYLTPDGRNVIFNSIATGCAQVYAARVPEGFLDAVAAL